MTTTIAWSGCNKFLDVNDTPNNPLAVPPSTLLSTGLAGTAFAVSNELNRFASTIMSVTAGAAGSPAAWDIYAGLTGAEFGNQWNFELYGGALINYKKMIEAAEAQQGPAYVGIGKIMMAYTFSVVTNVWGDVPYSEALQGDMQVTTPRLDSQRDIYLGNTSGNIRGLMDMVREGLADLSRESVLRPGATDLVYGGNIERWRRAGNSLLLKLAMQISQVEPAIAAQVIREVMDANQYINENAGNLSVRFGGQVGSHSPLWTLTHNSLFENELMISTRFLNLLERLNDPRLPNFVTRVERTPGATPVYVTIDNGFRGVLPLAALTNPARKGRSVYNTYATGVSGEGPVRLLTYAQTSFILAEAVLRFGLPGDAQALYAQGIRASMAEAGINASDIDGYFNGNPSIVTLSGSMEQQIEQVITQKYISLFSNGLEQWNDWRRTGYPTLAEHQNAGGIDGTRPVRAVYLFTEQQRNPNFPQGTAVPMSNVPVWWDVN
ncbi:SusD/RagB family nutrient-binding outer membrane lipoprotein [Sphingobacterium griseoflavum]|uniref:SusD/RagB family nutrient-binding outer membrane lipoprotein n=1 Tax=Sphingobacterium griseoflavum TaxID=1474952 RepID=A0ABQ3HXG9_9SPHI|nr:SusD/RagB family nutrient-binding outer membrane lipoprotein [Sphingobacterium griseoflavum]GHE37542.1 hypothetical protein GCM10017764_21010 [Sphingobacterium griseoflavum]